MKKKPSLESLAFLEDEPDYTGETIAFVALSILIIIICIGSILGSILGFIFH